MVNELTDLGMNVSDAFVREEEPSTEGGLLAVTEDGVIGWGRDLQSLGIALNVILLINDNVSGVGIADRYDLDLVRSRVGPGIPGFVIPLRPQLSERLPLRLTLRDTKGRVLGTPLIVEEHRALSYSMESDLAEYEGMVDGLRDGVLLGWARSISVPDRPITVELFDGQDRIARQLSNGYRDDLMGAGKSQGRCAFAFDLPISMLDGREHSLRVVVAGTSIELRNGPIQFGRLSASSLFEEIVRLRQDVERLQRSIDKIVTPNGMLQSQIVQTLSERISALSEIQREALENELDALRKIAFAQLPAGIRSKVPARKHTVTKR